jgi:hypothetical protein
MLTRALATLLGLFHTANGLYMLAAPQTWFAAAPGAADTGPFNPHFVADLGFAFLAGGLGFLAFAWRPPLRLIALGASGFQVFHALLHLFAVVRGHSHHLPTDLAVIALPAFLGLAIAWPRTGDVNDPVLRQSSA